MLKKQLQGLNVKGIFQLQRMTKNELKNTARMTILSRKIFFLSHNE